MHNWEMSRWQLKIGIAAKGGGGGIGVNLKSPTATGCGVVFKESMIE
jgi:hypothetical protein